MSEERDDYLFGAMDSSPFYDFDCLMLQPWALPIGSVQSRDLTTRCHALECENKAELTVYFTIGDTHYGVPICKKHQNKTENAIENGEEPAESPV